MEIYDESTHQSDCRPETQAHYLLMKYVGISRLHHSILDQCMSKTGVYRSQHQILMLLSKHENASQKEIAQWNNVSTATIAVSVKKLERGGYITRVMDQEDNRYNKLRLTDKGWNMAKYSRRFFRNVESRMFHDFSGEDYEMMESFLDRIHTNLTGIIPEDMTERED